MGCTPNGIQQFLPQLLAYLKASCSTWSDLWLKCIKSVYRPGSARTRKGSLQRSPDPLAGREWTRGWRERRDHPLPPIPGSATFWISSDMLESIHHTDGRPNFIVCQTDSTSQSPRRKCCNRSFPTECHSHYLPVCFSPFAFRDNVAAYWSSD